MTSMTVEPFQTRVEGLLLRGSHYLPAGDGPHPTAVLLHGFGGSRVETTGVFVTLARALTDAGIGVVAYDRAGHGESDGDFFDTTATGDIRQAGIVLEAIAELDLVDAENVHLVGMSMGAVIASAVAARAGRRVRSLTMWSTAALFVDEIRSGSIQGRSLEALDTEGFFDFLGMRMGPAMRDDARTFDVYGSARGYGGPVLLLHGTDDFIPVSYAERYTAGDVFGDRAELVVVPGADHGWAQLPQRDTVIGRTRSFLVEHCGRGAA